ncbi:hypothetical protein CIW47_19015 [Mycolicibacterium sp. P1-5]|nr:hypothetical protein CIW47_19015 [Mycolicibacterium sp. P1-5]
MATSPARRLISATIGAAAGYLAWLAGAAIIVATAPVRFWAVSGAILLAVLTSLAVVLAVRNRHTASAAAFWSAPILPIFASLYVLVVVMT